MKFGAAYIRVSTDDQLEYSPDSQLKLIREEAARRDYLIPDELVFQDDGISGKSAAKRPAFQRLITAAKQKPLQFETIFLWKFSRFARNQEESIVYKSMLSRLGISVVSISEPIIDGPFGTLIERILEWQDEYYLVNLSGEVRRGMLEKFSRGEPVSTPPVGYDLTGGKYVPNGDAELVRRVFLDYAAGVGMRRIADRLNASGYRTRRGNRIESRWVEYMLHNPTYIGKLRWTPDGRGASTRKYDDPRILIVDGKHEPLIDKELFDQVQQRLASVRDRYSHRINEAPAEYMLRGMVRCSSCGNTLTRVVREGTEMALQCHAYAKGSCPVSHHTSYAKLVKALVNGLLDASDTLNFTLTPEQQAKARTTDEHDKLIAKEQQKLKRATDAYLAGAFTLDQFRQTKDEIEARLKTYQAEKAAASAPFTFDKAAFAAKVRKVADYIQSEAPEQAKNQALRSVAAYTVYSRPTNTLQIFFSP